MTYDPKADWNGDPINSDVFDALVKRSIELGVSKYMAGSFVSTWLEADEFPEEYANRTAMPLDIAIKNLEEWSVHLLTGENLKEWNVTHIFVRDQIDGWNLVATTKEYTIIKDVSGWRVIFFNPAINPQNYDSPQHASIEVAGRWADEMLALSVVK